MNAGGGLVVDETAEILASAHDAWIALDHRARIVGWNPAAERMYGFASEEIRGLLLEETILPPRLRKRFRLGFDRYLETGEASFLGRRIETFACDRAGQEFPIEVAMSLAGSGDDTILHAFVRDLTGRRRAERYAEAQRVVTDLLVREPYAPDLLEQVTGLLATALEATTGRLWLCDPESQVLTETLVVRSGAPADCPVSLTSAQRDAAWTDVSPRITRIAGPSATGCAGIWIPVGTPEAIDAVIEILSDDVHAFCPLALERLGAVGVHVGHVVQRRRTEARIAVLHQRQSSILDAAWGAIVGLSSDGRVTFANPDAATWFGRDAQTLLGMTLHDLVSADAIRAGGHDGFAEALAGGQRTRRDDQYLEDADGATRIIDWMLVPLPDETHDGSPGAVLTFRDVTARTRLAQARHQELDFLQLVLESTGEGIVGCDAEGRITIFNRFMRETFGAADDLPPAEWPDRFKPRHAATGEPIPVAEMPLVRALAGKRVSGVEMLLRSSAGDPRSVIVNARQLVDRDGAVRGAVAIVHDVTDERVVQHRLEEAERVTGVGAWELDLDSRKVYWSPGLFWLLGVEPGSIEASEDAWVNAIVADDRARTYAEFEHAVESGAEGLELDYEIIGLDGVRRTIHCRCEIGRDEDGRARKITGLLHDNTARAEADLRARRAETRARQADRMDSLGQLAGGVAHDFNNLLAVILNYSEFLLEDIEPASEHYSDLKEIRKAAQRAADLTRRLLVFSRREMVRPQSVSLSALVLDLEPMLRRTLGEHLKLIVDLEPNGPLVSADPGQLEQIVMNLALNARDAMEQGGVLTIAVTTVEVGADDDESLEAGRYVSLRVADTGTGMRPEIAAHVFDPFFTTKAKGRGTGLGLATAYGIVHEAGGFIGVRSAPGKGSEFTVLLPVAASPAAVADAPAPKVEIDPCTSRRLRVLVVEDEAAVRRVTARILWRDGYEVLDAASGEEALIALEQCDGRVDLVLSDVVMPGMSGWDLHLEVAERWPEIPTLFMSAYTADLVGRTALEGKSVEFIGKPFATSELRAVVSAHVRRH